MTKRFFLAALAAIALTMGFTACSDDENEPSGKYEVSAFLRLNQVSNDAAETQLIAKTYINSLGSTGSEDSYVTITGKDSLDCVNTIKNMCAKAEAELDGKQWNDLTAISVGIVTEKYTTVLYSKTFGKAADNASLVIKKFGPNVTNRGGHTATAIKLNSQSIGLHWLLSNFENLKFAWMDDYPYYNPIDLNAYSYSSKYVYAMFDNEGITSLKDIQKLVLEDDHNEELNKYIADVVVFINSMWTAQKLDDVSQFTYNGVTYKFACRIDDNNRRCNLNDREEYSNYGKNIYLYYSTDAVKLQRVIDIDECVIARNDGSNQNFGLNEIGVGRWNCSKLVELLTAIEKKVVFEREDANFNEAWNEPNGAVIHMRADYISFDELKQLTFDENGNAIKN